MSLLEKVFGTTKPFEQKWKPGTPAIEAELTDHVWTSRELLTIIITRRAVIKLLEDTSMPVQWPKCVDNRMPAIIDEYTPLRHLLSPFFS